MWPALTGPSMVGGTQPSILHGRAKCSHRGHSRHLFGDMTDTFRLGQVDGRDPMGGKEDAIVTVAVAGSYGDALSSESFRDFPSPAFEQDVISAGGYSAHDLVLAVFRSGQALGHGSWAGAIAIGRNLELQGFVGSLEVIDLAPGIEGTLHRPQIAKALASKDLLVQRAVEACVLAAALWMRRAGVD